MAIERIVSAGCASVRTRARFDPWLSTPIPPNEPLANGPLLERFSGRPSPASTLETTLFHSTSTSDLGVPPEVRPTHTPLPAGSGREDPRPDTSLGSAANPNPRALNRDNPAGRKDFRHRRPGTLQGHT